MHAHFSYSLQQLLLLIAVNGATNECYSLSNWRHDFSQQVSINLLSVMMTKPKNSHISHEKIQTYYTELHNLKQTASL